MIQAYNKGFDVVKSFQICIICNTASLINRTHFALTTEFPKVFQYLSHLLGSLKLRFDWCHCPLIILLQLYLYIQKIEVAPDRVCSVYIEF